MAKRAKSMSRRGNTTRRGNIKRSRQPMVKKVVRKGRVQ